MVKRRGDRDVQRYAVLVFIGIIICFWIMVCLREFFLSSVVYIIMGFGSLGGYLIWRGLYGKGKGGR